MSKKENQENFVILMLMNHLEGMTHLKNAYYAVRHGESRANQEGIIISDLKRGGEAFGLTKEGSRQVRESIRRVIRDGVVRIDEPVVIFASPFLRTRQTAVILEKELDAPKYFIDSRLGEREFGHVFDKRSDAHYQTVWDQDIQSIYHTHYGVESVAQVEDRMTGFVMNVEDDELSQYQCGAKTIFLVSHGDPLNILETAFKGKDAAQHRAAPLKTGEIRKLEWKA